MIAAADVVALRSATGTPQILLIKRKYEPFKDAWALPGGIVEPKEEVQTTAQRELAEETGLNVPRQNLKFVDYFDAPERDPRKRAISFTFRVAIADENVALKAGDDAAQAQWFALDELPELAFDHRTIIARCCE